MSSAMCLVEASVLQATEIICRTRALFAQLDSHCMRPMTMESGAPVSGEQPLSRESTVVRRDDRWAELAALGPASYQSIHGVQLQLLFPPIILQLIFQKSCIDYKIPFDCVHWKTPVVKELQSIQISCQPLCCMLILIHNFKTLFVQS